VSRRKPEFPVRRRRKPKPPKPKHLVKQMGTLQTTLCGERHAPLDPKGPDFTYLEDMLENKVPYGIDRICGRCLQSAEAVPLLSARDKASSDP